MHTNRCERCGSTNDVCAVWLFRALPAVLCVRCQRDFDETFLFTKDGKNWSAKYDNLQMMRLRAANAEANDMGFWRSFQSAQRAADEATDLLRPAALAWLAETQGGTTDGE